MTPDDSVTTFVLEKTGFRGRIITLGPVLDAIMQPHPYPQAVKQATAEAATLATLLASMLKYQGIFTLQAQGDGPLAVTVADFTSEGHLRACATIRDGRKAEIGESATPAKLFGKGYLAFTVDQGPETERYQGIVELKPGGLTDSVQHYFRQSEQIATGLRMAVAFKGGHWHAGGILVQHVPGEGGLNAPLSSVDEDDWRRTMMLLQTCADEELTDPSIGPNDLLFRLFHEEGVIVQPPLPLRKGCRCTDERLQGIIAGMPERDRLDMMENGKITMTCEFCSRDFVFDPDLKI